MREEPKLGWVQIPRVIVHSSFSLLCVRALRSVRKELGLVYEQYTSVNEVASTCSECRREFQGEEKQRTVHICVESLQSCLTEISS